MSEIRYHRVQYGETLATLAKMYYNCADTHDVIVHAQYIYQHNSAFIPNPNVIFPGQLLALPHAWASDY